jgi:Holliday junction resolvase RusA-like endonuclease
LTAQSIKFTVPGKPIPQPRMIDGDIKRGKRGNAYAEKIDPAAKKKTDFLLKALIHRPDKPFDCPLQVNLRFFFQRPESHYGRYNGKPYLPDNAPQWPALRKRNDIDNLTKFVFDALTGEFWLDDGLICRSMQEKCYTDKLPYTEIEILPLI